MKFSWRTVWGVARSLLDPLVGGNTSSVAATTERTPVGSDVHGNLGSNTRREIEPTFFFMLNCLLYIRLETGYPSNQDFYDEDVNVYLANLLCSFMKPEYHRRARAYLSPYDTSLFEKIENSTDARLKYTIYKTNADFLLISIGIFDNAHGKRPDTAHLFRSSEEACMGRGKAYYHFAYTYSQSAIRKSAGITDILEKLSKGFERYAEILSHMRGEYFNILDRLSDGEIYHLERSVDPARASRELRALQDRFLDVYSEYLRTKDPGLRHEVEDLARRLRALDESFDFHMDA